MVLYVAFRGVHEPHGWFGNMAPYPVTHEDLPWRTTEALFQALRFADPAVRDAIRSQKSPMAAKMIAKREKSKMVVVPQSREDLDNMRKVLRLKIAQHPKLKRELKGTGEKQIIEDCSRRARGSGLFWGAALRDGVWVGENRLGVLWMELRAEMST